MLNLLVLSYDWASALYCHAELDSASRKNTSLNHQASLSSKGCLFQLIQFLSGLRLGGRNDKMNSSLRQSLSLEDPDAKVKYGC